MNKREFLYFLLVHWQSRMSGSPVSPLLCMRRGSMGGVVFQGENSRSGIKCSDWNREKLQAYVYLFCPIVWKIAQMVSPFPYLSEGRISWR